MSHVDPPAGMQGKNKSALHDARRKCFRPGNEYHTSTREAVDKQFSNSPENVIDLALPTKCHVWGTLEQNVLQYEQYFVEELQKDAPPTLCKSRPWHCHPLLLDSASITINK